MIKVKAILSALLTLLFSVSIGGTFHYCGGTLAQFKLLVGDTHTGCEMEFCEMTGNSGNSFHSDCCNDSLVVIDVDDYQFSSKPDLKAAELTLWISSLSCFSHFDIINEALHFYSCKYPPENLTSVDLSRIQVFLI